MSNLAKNYTASDMISFAYWVKDCGYTYNQYSKKWQPRVAPEMSMEECMALTPKQARKLIEDAKDLTDDELLKAFLDYRTQINNLLNSNK